MQKYMVVSNKSNTSHTLARQRVGTAGYVAIATFTDEPAALRTAALLNEREEQNVQGKSK
jgi:predicted DNA-binding WGR domain protein